MSISRTCICPMNITKFLLILFYGLAWYQIRYSCPTKLFDSSIRDFKENKLKKKTFSTHQTFIDRNAETNNMFYQLTISFLSFTLRPNIRCLPINNTSMEIELSNLMVLSVKRVNYSLFNYELKNFVRQNPIIALKE